MGSRILLADDSITIQKVVNLTFADEGIEVVAVSSGDLAERRLNEVKPDLVLADIFMPGKNGYELCEAIKQNSQFRNVPVVLLVGAFEPFDQAEARRVRADAHLTKPFESRTLVETVRRLIGTTVSTPSSSMAPSPAPNGGHEEVRDAHDEGPMSSRLQSAPVVKLDLSAMSVDSNVTLSTRPARTTGELASPAPDSASGALGLGLVDTPTHEVLSATLTDTSERFEPMELSSTDAFAPVAPPPAQYGPDAQETILDFEKSDSAGLLRRLETVSFDAEASAVLDLDVGVGEGAQWSSRDSIETATLDVPSGDAAWQSSETTTSISQNATDFSPQAVAFGASEASTETAVSTLLAIDEPLGDLLLDEAISVNPASHSQNEASDSLDFELAESGTVGDVAAASTQFSLVDADEGSSSQPSLTQEDKHVEPEVHASEGTLRVADQPDPFVADTPADAYPASQVTDSLPWTSPRAGVYSTDQLDSVVMPIDEAEQPPSEDTDHAHRLHDTEEASFTTASTWEEPARFTPIDIEAVPVEGSKLSADWSGGPETGFSFSSVAAEEPTTSIETQAMGPTAGTTDEPAVSAAELSSAAIEEIVRRVVAEMSESVVREVAWEVVPDCVERVIQQLTRESLSKQL